MKIFYLIFNLCHQGGMERVLTQKVNYLSEKLGYDITIVTMHQKGRLPFFELSPKVKMVDLGVNTHIKLLIPLYLRRLEKLSLAQKPDIIMSMCYGEMPYLDKLRDNSVKMAEFHFSYESFAIRDRLSQRRTFEKSIGKFSKFIVLTDEDKASWERFSSNVVRIYNPVTLETTPSALQDKRCIAAGRLVPQKDYPAMLRIWEKVHRYHPDWTLDIFGEGKQADNLRKMARDLGVEDVVKINPATKDLAGQMRTSAIYLMTSTYEGMPLVLVEASRAGLPAVAFRCPCGPSEIIQDSVTGYTVPVGNEEEYASKVCALIENESLRREMGEKALLRSREFSLEAIMAQWDALFKGAIAE